MQQYVIEDVTKEIYRNFTIEELCKIITINGETNPFINSSDFLRESAILYGLPYDNHYTIFDIYSFSKKSKTQLVLYAIQKNDIRVVKFNLKYGVKSKYMTEACINGHLEIVRLLLEYQAPMNENLMINACIKNNIEIVRLLLEYQAPINENAMRAACINGHLEIVRVLLEHGAPMDENPMIDACIKNYIEIVKLLLEYQAPINENAMIAASLNGRIEIVKLLLFWKKEAFPNVTTGYEVPINFNIIPLAIKKGQIEIANLLSTYKAIMQL